MVERTLNIKHISTIINLHQSNSVTQLCSNIIVMYANSNMEHYCSIHNCYKCLLLSRRPTTVDRSSILPLSLVTQRCTAWFCWNL